MVTLIAQYLLVGAAIALVLEIFIRWIGEDVSHVERFQLIVGWPIMVLIFIYNFIKGMLED